MTVHIIGNPVSPYVRKVFVALLKKGAAFDFDPIVPFFGNEEFDQLSPLRRIPVLVDGDFVLNDSTVIAEYIEDYWPDPALYPKNIKDRARARWLEEYADSRIGHVMIWGLFYESVIGPRIFKSEPNQEKLAKILEIEIPSVMDWLENELPAEGFLFGDSLMLADVALQMCFVNAAYARWMIDADRWPRAAAWLARVEADPEVALVRRWADIMVSSKRDALRDNLVAGGAVLWEKSYAAPTPRPGIMPI